MKKEYTESRKYSIRAVTRALLVLSVLCIMLLPGCSGGQQSGTAGDAGTGAARPGTDDISGTVSAACAADTELYTDKDGDLSGKNYEYTVNEDGTLTLTGYSGDSAVPLIPSEIDGKKVVKLERTFSKNTRILQADVPDGVTEIGEFAFYMCRSMKKVGLPDTVGVIKNQAFGECMALEEVTFPSGELTIYTSAFQDCRSLASFTLSGNMTVNKDAFIQSGITSLTIADDVAVIPEQAFKNCVFLESVHIPSRVRIIEDKAFDGCKSLGCVTFDEGLKSIRAYAFAGCENLREISLPKSLDNIGPGTFYGCDIKVHAAKDAFSYLAWGDTYKNEVHYYCDDNGSITWEVDIA